MVLSFFFKFKVFQRYYFNLVLGGVCSLVQFIKSYPILFRKSMEFLAQYLLQILDVEIAHYGHA